MQKARFDPHPSHKEFAMRPTQEPIRLPRRKGEQSMKSSQEGSQDPLAENGSPNGESGSLSVRRSHSSEDQIESWRQSHLENVSKYRNNQAPRSTADVSIYRNPKVSIYRNILTGLQTG